MQSLPSGTSACFPAFLSKALGWSGHEGCTGWWVGGRRSGNASRPGQNNSAALAAVWQGVHVRKASEGWKCVFGILTLHRSEHRWSQCQPPFRHAWRWGGEGNVGLCGGSALGMSSKFKKTLSKQLCDSTHIFLGAAPTLICIQVPQSSSLFWCCFWEDERCGTNSFFQAESKLLSSSH